MAGRGGSRCFDRVQADTLIVGDDQERWVVHVALVAQELIVGSIEVAVRALVFPTEGAAFPDIGETFAADGFGEGIFEDEGLIVAVGPRGVGMTNQVAEVSEVFLVPLAFVGGGLAPFGFEVLCCHGVDCTGSMGG